MNTFWYFVLIFGAVAASVTHTTEEVIYKRAWFHEVLHAVVMTGHVVRTILLQKRTQIRHQGLSIPVLTDRVYLGYKFSE